MTRISRNISDISVICCFFYGQRIARIARNYFFYHQMNLMNLMAGTMNYLVNLVNLVIIFQTLFVLFVVSVGKRNCLLLNKLLSPEPKTYELL